MQKKLLIIVILLILVIFVELFFLLRNTSHITVKNESDIYTLQYIPSEKLETYLKRWDLVENKIKTDKDEKQKNLKIKRVTIILTDTPQASPVLTDKNDHALFSETTSIDTYQNLTVIVSIDPQLRKTDLLSLNRSFTLTILSSLIKISPYNPSKNLENDFTAANKDLSTPGNQPFIIGIQHE